MKWWLLARLGRAMLAAWGITSLVFLGSRQLPVSPEQLSLSEMGSLTHSPDSAQLAASQQAIRQRLGLAEPVFYWTRVLGSPPRWQWHGTHNQYHHWVRQLLHGNLGYSYRNGQPVTQLLAQALAVSVPLTGSAAVLATGLALGLALYLASGSRGKWRASLRAGLATLQVLPGFLVALALLLLFANPDVLNVVPAAGRAPAAPLAAVGYWAARALLPLLSLLLVVLPILTLPLAAALRYELGAGYVTTARAKGLPLRRVLRRHALPNALLPLLTTLTELLPTLVAGTVVVEVIFALPGSGRLLAEATATHDYPVVVGSVLLVAAVRLLGLVLADVLYFLIDPRLRPDT